MKLRKVIFSAFAVTLAAASLVSCGADKNSKSSMNSNSTTASSEIVSSSEKQEYTISYMLNGGTNPSSNPTTYTGEEDITLIDPTKEGYTFDGWSTNGDKFTKNYVIEAGTTGNILIAAKWTANTYAVTLDLNGGKVSYITTDIEDTVTYGKKYNPSTPTREGYTFDGWYYGDIKFENGNYLYAKDITLVAKWKAKSFTIALDANGGEVSTTSLNVTYGEAYELPTPTREGYTFEGWYNDDTKIETTGTWSTLSSSNLTLKAKWSIKVCTLTLDANGGEVSTASLNVTYGEAYELPTPTREGYTFEGWYNDDTKIETTGTWSTLSSGNLTLKAKWSIKVCTLTLDANGGEVSIASKNITYGKAYQLPTPTRDGYTFAGWYNGDTLFAQTGTCETEGSITLVAKWTANTYSVVLNYNDESTTNQTVELTYGEAYELPTPTREHYTFAGWYYGDTLVENTGNWSIAGNVTLEAKWVGEKHNIHLYTSGGGIYSASSNNAADITLEYGKEYTLPTPVSNGYDFLGWYYGDTLIPLTGVSEFTEDITLTAKWEETVYTLVLNTNGGLGADKTTYSCAYEDEIDLPVLVKTNYKFLGWYYDDEKVTQSFFSVLDDATLEAKWQYNANTYYVTYNPSEGYTTSVKYQEVTVGEAYSLEVLEKDDYTFEGWYSNLTLIPASGTWSTASNLTLTEAFYQDNLEFTYLSASDSYSVKYTGTATVVVVPSIYNGKYVTAVGTSAFYSNTTVTRITLPDTIDTIGSYAFYNCNKLESVNLNSNLTAIGNSTFYNCQSLKTLYLSDDITTIGTYAFHQCYALTSISLPSKLETIGAYALNGCTKLEYITVPNGVTEISYGTFANCTNLTFLTLSDNLTSYEPSMITGCSNISYHHYFGGLYLSSNSYDFYMLVMDLDGATYISVHADCKWIWKSAAKYNTSLTELIVNNRTAVIGDHAFYGCTALETVTFYNSIAFTIGDYAFCDCTSLSTVTFKNDVCTSIGSSAFLSCSSLKSIVIPSTVTYIGMWAFDGSGLTSAEFKDPDGWWTSDSSGSKYEDITFSTTKSKAATQLLDCSIYYLHKD
ncbi:MAG: InlB B-repeat-containing protein [Acholeplasmatales bacterium]|nr:InlB B-repeat-containing protein [Acholeplasmatales bacterium]